MRKVDQPTKHNQRVCVNLLQWDFLVNILGLFVLFRVFAAKVNTSKLWNRIFKRTDPNQASSSIISRKRRMHFIIDWLNDKIKEKSPKTEKNKFSVGLMHIQKQISEFLKNVCCDFFPNEFFVCEKYDQHKTISVKQLLTSFCQYLIEHKTELWPSKYVFIFGCFLKFVVSVMWNVNWIQCVHS